MSSPLWMDEYQQRASETAIYPGQSEFGGLIYCALKLNGEAGEIADKVGKAIRDNNSTLTTEALHALHLELGDVLWYVANLATELGMSLNDIARMNLGKLADRKRKGTLQGSGDER